ncbi:MAG TPA: sugar phosphate isomerase/epimerase [Bryobacteraceae bacterium]|nr:sugar phosphate isomerase/epimerase [Bryobacteraceae bacterium]
MHTRRDFARIALAGVPLSIALAKINSTFHGVRLGAQTYSFRDRPLDAVIEALVEVGLGDCELYAPHVEPKASREDLRKWRLTVSMDEFKAVRKKFDDAGISVYAYNYSFVDDFTDAEIDRGFDMAHALGVGVITASSTLSAARRVVPFAEKHQMTVAYHGHSNIKDPNEFARPESFAAALAMSPRFAINLDIGHFTAAGYDAVEYIQAHQDRILVLHLKDRKKNQGPNMPWGQGDTPIKQVLQLLKENRYPMRAFIEYEYQGKDDAVTEVKRCFQYCKDALA